MYSRIFTSAQQRPPSQARLPFPAEKAIPCSSSAFFAMILLGLQMEIFSILADDEDRKSVLGCRSTALVCALVAIAWRSFDILRHWTKVQSKYFTNLHFRFRMLHEMRMFVNYKVITFVVVVARLHKIFLLLQLSF